jgi:hypothetical protein
LGFAITIVFSAHDPFLAIRVLFSVGKPKSCVFQVAQTFFDDLERTNSQIRMPLPGPMNCFVKGLVI